MLSCISVFKQKRELHKAGPAHRSFDLPHKFVTSPVIRNPFVFAAVRLTIAFFALFTLLFTLIWLSIKDKEGNSYFSYFTRLTFTGLCAYYFAAGTQTLAYALKWRKGGAGVGYPLQRWPSSLQVLHVTLQSTVITFPLLVSIVFWALLAKPSSFEGPFSSFHTVVMHVLNAAFALFEILFSNSPPPPLTTLLFNIVILAGYLGVAYITQIRLGFYPYNFLDPKKQGAKLAIYIVGIAVGEVVIFFIVKGTVVLRERWAIRSGRVLRVEALESGSASDSASEWEEIRRTSAHSIGGGA